MPFSRLAVDFQPMPNELGRSPSERRSLFHALSSLPGFPKARALSTNGKCTDARACPLQFIHVMDHVTPDDRIIAILPYFHIYGMQVRMPRLCLLG